MKLFKKLALIASVILLAPGLIYAQQDMIMSQYMTNLMPTNAAYTGTTGNLNAMFVSRNQWVGFDGAPQTNVLLINSPLIKKNIGLGMTLIQDKVGPLTQTLVFADVAYNFQITEKFRLSMGTKAGFNVQQPDLSALSLEDTGDPMFNGLGEVEFLPNFGFGLYLYSEKMYLGISSPKLKKNEMNLGTIGAEGGEERHYYFIGGYLHEISPTVKYRPTFFLKMVKGAPLSMELTNSVILQDKLWFGFMYRFGDALGFMMQYNITDHLKVGYSYDYAITELSNVSSGTHEILISYDLFFKTNKIVTPRYF